MALKKHKLAGPRSIADLVKLKNKSIAESPQEPSTMAMPSSDIADKMEELKDPKLSKKKKKKEEIADGDAQVGDDKPMISVHVFGSKGK